MTTMSFSFQEPDWPPVCECRYDEVRDEIDRGNCQLHCDSEEVSQLPEEHATAQPASKKAAAIAKPDQENAA